MTTIDLPHGGKNAQFKVVDLVREVRNSKRGYIIIGKSNAVYRDHPKVKSLDYWLRSGVRVKDTRQVTDKVVSDVVATGYFKRARHPCPESGRLCNALELAKK